MFKKHIYLSIYLSICLLNMYSLNVQIPETMIDR